MLRFCRVVGVVVLTTGIVLGATVSWAPLVPRASAQQPGGILVPIQGAWRNGPVTLIFLPGDQRDDRNFICGDVIGNGGARNRYLYQSTGPATGVMYFDTPGGRQGPIFVTLLPGGKMQWQMGTETLILTR